MIYAELPKSRPGIKRTIQKKHTSVITPYALLYNEKVMLSLMFAGMAAVFITWAVKGGK